MSNRTTRPSFRWAQARCLSPRIRPSDDNRNSHRFPEFSPADLTLLTGRVYEELRCTRPSRLHQLKVWETCMPWLNGLHCWSFRFSLRARSNSPACPRPCCSDRCWRRLSPAPTAQRCGFRSTCFAAGQALVGCLVAASLSLAIFATFLDEWMLFACVVMSTLVASSFLGWFISRFKISSRNDGGLGFGSRRRNRHGVDGRRLWRGR